MSPDPTPSETAEDPDSAYTIDVIAAMAGVEVTTVVRYHEQGFLRPVQPEGGRDLLMFDADGLRQLRRAEHLRATCGVNEAGLRLILGLLEEVEQLRAECRRMTR